jgi:hypothetical protein
VRALARRQAGRLADLALMSAVEQADGRVVQGAMGADLFDRGGDGADGAGGVGIA